MTAHMAYRTIEPAADPDALAEIFAFLGSSAIDAWLEDDLCAAGIALQQGISLAVAAERIATWPRGRLFNETADLRWERAPGGLTHLVAVTDAAPPHGWDGWIKLGTPSVEQPYYLWGERKDGRWEDSRVPALARAEIYPGAWTGPYAVVWVKTYEATPITSASRRTVTRYLRYDGCYQPPAERPSAGTRSSGGEQR